MSYLEDSIVTKRIEIVIYIIMGKQLITSDM